MNDIDNLVKLYQEGNQEVLDDIIKYSERYMKYVIKRFMLTHYTNYLVEYGDLYQIAVIGVINAAKGYNKDDKSSFLEWCKIWILAGLKREVAKLGVGIPAKIQINNYSLLPKIREYKTNYYCQHGKCPTKTELKHKFNLSDNEINTIELFNISPLSLDCYAITSNNNSTILKDLLVSDSNVENEVCSKEIFQYLQSIFHSTESILNYEEKYILKSRYNNTKVIPREEIAQQLSVSRETIRRREQNIIVKIKQYLKKKY